MNSQIKQMFELHDYQEQCVDFMIAHPRCGLFLKMGLGKTRAVLAGICELNIPCHVLVIAPAVIARTSWVDEIKELNIPLRYKSFITNERSKKGRDLSKKAREKLYEEAKNAPPTVYFVSRDVLSSMVDYFGNDWCFPFIVADESHGIKSFKSVRFKSLKKILHLTHHMVLLSGTPAPKGLIDLWTQIYLLDGGTRLGYTISSYRETYFRPGYIINGNPVSWTALPGSKEKIYEKINDIVISMDSDMIELPGISYNYMRAYLSEEEKEIYKTMAKEKVFTFSDDTDIIATNAGVLTGKLMQIASGHVYIDKEHNFITIHERKLELLQYIYDNEPEPILVAYWFKTDIDAILKRFSDAVLFDGTRQMKDEWNAGKIRMMLIHPASAGSGLNFQIGGHTLVWYTLPWSLELYQQTEKRLYRQGQKNPVVIHILLTANTIEEKIPKVLASRDDEQESLMRAVKLEMNEVNSNS